MNVKQAVESATAQLLQCSDSANLDARIIACLACGIEQTTLITQPELLLNPEQQKSFDAYLSRRVKGEPIAYLTGTKEFWSLNFKVNKHVLIPRPETELLVELALELVSKIESPRILDLGTGSGAIAVAIAKERPDAKMTATDRSVDAMKIAEQNADTHKVTIRLITSDWFNAIKDKDFNLIICNPPYIGKQDPNLATHVSTYEPEHALISKDDGVYDLRTIISEAKPFLSSAGHLLVEHGFQQAEVVQKIFSAHGYPSIDTHKDLAGLARVTIGQNSEKA